MLRGPTGSCRSGAPLRERREPPAVAADTAGACRRPPCCSQPAASVASSTPAASASAGLGSSSRPLLARSSNSFTICCQLSGKCRFSSLCDSLHTPGRVEVVRWRQVPKAGEKPWRQRRQRLSRGARSSRPQQAPSSGLSTRTSCPPRAGGCGTALRSGAWRAHARCAASPEVQYAPEQGAAVHPPLAACR